jgi:hypothetical protein
MHYIVGVSLRGKENPPDRSYGSVQTPYVKHHVPGQGKKQLKKNIGIPFVVAHSCISVRTIFLPSHGENIY